MTSLRLFTDSGLAEDEVLLDSCSLTVRFSSRLSPDLVRQALLDRLSAIAAASGHSLPVDFSPEVHVHLTLLSDTPSIPADRRLALSHLTLRLEEHLQKFVEMGFKAVLTSQFLRGLRMSASYQISGAHNISYITNAAFRPQLGRLDVLLSKSSAVAYRQFQVIVYLPDIALLHGRRLRAIDSMGRRKDPLPGVSGFSFNASSRVHHFLIWNDEHYLELHRAVTLELRRWLGLERDYVDEFQKMVPFNGTSLKFSFDDDICGFSESPEVWDAYLLQVMWTRRGAMACEVAFSDLKRLSALPGYKPPPSHLLKSSPAAEGQDAGISAAWGSAAALRSWYERARNSNSEEFTWEQTFVIMAPFWIPLLAPLIKLLLKRR